jgi:imidazolonepropionase
MLLIRGARQLITLRGSPGPRRGRALNELEIIHDGALLIHEGRIVEVGGSRRVENLAIARKADEWDLTGRVVMPGFVDCHTHLVCGLPWHSEYEAAAGVSAEAAMDAVRRSTAQRLASRARHILAGMARHGTTTLEAKSGYGLDATGELKILRALGKLHRKPLDIVPTFLCPRGLPPGFEGDAQGYLRWICSDLLPKIQRRRLARFADFYCEDRTFSLEQCRYFLESARGLGLPLKIHSDQLRRDGGVRLAVDLEAVSADHLNYADPGDVQMLARSRTIAVLLPGRPFYRGAERYPPARELIDAGAAVALGTGFGPSGSPTYNMQMIVALACARMRMTPAEAICAATFNAACAIGCEPQAGSLEVGKAGDLIVLNAGDYREIAYHFGVNLVRSTLKHGVRIYEQGAVVVPQTERSAA